MNKYFCNKQRFFLFMLALGLTLWGCQKEKKWKQPVPLSMSIDVDKTRQHPNALEFERGNVILERVTIAGNRKEADAIYFEKTFPDGLTVSLDSSIFVSELEFQIPQGTYTNFQVALHLREAREHHKSLKLKGLFKNPHNDSIPVLVELEEELVWQLNVIAAGEELVFDQKIPMVVAVNLDAPFWFANISQGQLNNADTEEVEDVETIVINDDENELLFNMIEQRIAQGVKGKFKKK